MDYHSKIEIVKDHGVQSVWLGGIWSAAAGRKNVRTIFTIEHKKDRQFLAVFFVLARVELGKGENGSFFMLRKSIEKPEGVSKRSPKGEQ